MWRRVRSISPIVVSLIAAFALIKCSSILANALVRVKNKDELIRVIGSARKPIRSDLIIWRGRLTQTAPTLGQAYAQIKPNADRVKSYLTAKGVRPTEMFPLAISAETLYVKIKKPNPKAPANEPTETANGENAVNDSADRKLVGYKLTEEIEVRSEQVELVDRVARESTELISNGMQFESETPQYLYTKLGELKVTMQAEAAKDARARADQIAINSGCHVGEVRYARMSVPQITPLYSTQESDGGSDDTTSMDKKITAIVVAGFSIK